MVRWFNILNYLVATCLICEYVCVSCKFLSIYIYIYIIFLLIEKDSVTKEVDLSNGLVCCPLYMDRVQWLKIPLSCGEKKEIKKKKKE
jgi:hypothetical protein